MDATRPVLTALLTAVVLAAVAVVALLSGPTGGAPGVRAEMVASGLELGLGRLGGALPLGYAFAAGMLASVNPCGFALLPAYLGLHLGLEKPGSRWHRLIRALGFSAAVSLGAVLLFVTAGGVVGVAGRTVIGAVPSLGILVGAVLVGVGAWALVGGWLVPDMAHRLAPWASRPGAWGWMAYGVAYGLASLGCTLPVFLSVAALGWERGAAVAVLQLVLYGLGLGVVLTAVALLATVFGTRPVVRLRRVARHLPSVGAVLLLVTGAWVVYYWLTLGGVLGRLAG